MVREPDLLRGASTDHPGHLDGPGFSAPVGTRTEELLRHYKEPGARPVTEVKAAVDQLQILFDTSLVTSVQPKSLLTQMREAVAECDDVSSDGSLMLLSPPRDIPEAELPAGSAMEVETRDVESPVVMSRRVTPAN